MHAVSDCFTPDRHVSWEDFEYSSMSALCMLVTVEKCGLMYDKLSDIKQEFKPLRITKSRLAKIEYVTHIIVPAETLLLDLLQCPLKLTMHTCKHAHKDRQVKVKTKQSKTTCWNLYFYVTSLPLFSKLRPCPTLLHTPRPATPRSAPTLSPVPRPKTRTLQKTCYDFVLIRKILALYDFAKTKAHTVPDDTLLSFMFTSDIDHTFLCNACAEFTCQWSIHFVIDTFACLLLFFLLNVQLPTNKLCVFV